MACHTANMAFMALKLTAPTRVSAASEELNPETYPAWAQIAFDFPARGELPPVKFYWYEGRKDGKLVHPPQELQDKVVPLDKGAKGLSSSGSILVGDKGMIYSPNDYGAKFFLFPAKDFEGTNTSKPETLPVNGGGDGGQKKEWVEAIRAGKPALAFSNFDYAAMLTESILLGNVAIRAGKPIEWDTEKLKVTNDEKANAFIKTEYRKGWELAGEA